MSDQPAKKPETTTPPTPTGAKSMDAIMALCKRRGFIYQASEIYGGINGFWDYGPLGAQMKKNLREAWWRDMILNPCWGRKGPNGERVRCVPVETCIIQHPKVWEASGHVGGFNDPKVDCKECKSRFRADKLWFVALWDKPTWEAQFGPEIPIEELYAKWDIDPLSNLSNEEKRRCRAENATILRAPNLIIAVEADEVHDYQQVELTGKQRKSLADGQVRVGLVVRSDRAKAEDIWGRCPKCGGELTEPRQFNLMFKTIVGATGTEDDAAYLRPETAQGIFVQFKNVVDTTRVKLPFGIGNTGKSFRNEITPRNFTFRSREFEQAELEFFCHPDESQAWYAFWRDFRMEWWKSIGLAGDNLILREHDKDELSHYSCGTSDVEYRFPFTAPGFGELEGIAHRGNYDLTQHQEHSKVKLEYFDQERGELLPNGSRRGERYLPHCIEPAAGLDRGVLALLCEAYTLDPSRPSPELLKLHPRIAPIKAAVFPLVNKDGMPEIAEKLYDDLFAAFGRDGFIETDAKQSIGKRYARMDEAGCPFCLTIDGETLTNQTVTLRDRDTGTQERVALDQVVGVLRQRLGL